MDRAEAVTARAAWLRGFWAMFLGGLAAAVAGRGLPAVFAVPLAPLAGLIFFSSRRGSRIPVFFLPAACWCWMFACVVFSWRSPFFPAAALLLALGLIFDAAAMSKTGRAAFKFHARSFGPAASCAAAGAALFMPAALAAAMGRGNVEFGIFLPASAAAGCAAAWAFFGVPARDAQAARLMLTGARIGVAFACVSWGVRLAIPAAASAGAMFHAGAGNPGAAIALSARAAQDFGELGMKRRAVLALRVKSAAELNAGDRAAALKTSARILELEPNDADTQQLLFEAAIEARDPAGAYRFFPRMPGPVLSPEAIRVTAQGASAAGDPVLLCLLAGMPGAEDAASIMDDAVLWPAAQTAYFAGLDVAAGRLLAAALERGKGGWAAARLLFWLRSSAGDWQGAKIVLENVYGNEDLGEKSYFHALAAKAVGDAGAEREWLNRALAFDRDICAAARRLAVLDGSDEPAGVGSVVFDGTASLKSAVVDRAEVRAGDCVRVSFVWEINAPLDPQRRVFLHFRRRVYGGLMFQADHYLPPVRGTTCVPVGSCVRYDVDVEIPPNAAAGFYAVYAGLWDGAAGKRVAITGAADVPVTVTRKRDSLLIGRISVKNRD